MLLLIGLVVETLDALEFCLNLLDASRSLIGIESDHALDERVQDYSTYGYPRTFQIDAVVGHDGDSPAHPSHFTVINLRGSIIIIELPADQINKAIIYGGGQVTGDQPDLTPVTLSFQDEPGSKGLAMIVHIAGSTMIWLNNGSKFLAPSNGG